MGLVGRLVDPLLVMDLVLGVDETVVKAELAFSPCFGSYDCAVNQFERFWRGRAIASGDGAGPQLLSVQGIRRRSLPHLE